MPDVVAERKSCALRRVRGRGSGVDERRDDLKHGWRNSLITVGISCFSCDAPRILDLLFRLFRVRLTNELDSLFFALVDFHPASRDACGISRVAVTHFSSSSDFSSSGSSSIASAAKRLCTMTTGGFLYRPRRVCHTRCGSHRSREASSGATTRTIAPRWLLKRFERVGRRDRDLGYGSFGQSITVSISHRRHSHRV